MLKKRNILKALFIRTFEFDLFPNEYFLPQEYYLDMEKSRNLMTTSTATSLASLSKNSVGGDSLFPKPSEKLACHLDTQQDMEIGDLAKNFSSCANSFGHSVTHANSTALNDPQTLSFPGLCTDDEAAKDCL